jgi:FMN hydrolase / 5-amino-6-(5-phospho-D-ribitylamino)uracil phosphatase
VDAVAFDLMDTVVRDPFREALSAATPLTPEDLLSRRDPEGWPRFERGEITEAEYWSLYDGIPFDVDAFHRERRAGYRLIDGMGELLDDLAGRVTRVAATNYPVWVRELEEGLIRGRFEHVVASHDIGVRKPDPAFYRRLCELVEAPADRILFVDDRKVNVEAAATAGLRVHHFAGADDLRARLRSEGIGLAVGDGT